MFTILIFLQILSFTTALESLINKNESKSEKHNIYNAQIGFQANIYHDLYLLKNSIKTVEDQINKLTNLYDNKLDQKLSSFMNTMKNMDENIKNIQDKARVWDVFQHHISAWNEQIKSLDRKVDIISSGQEKMLLLDGKLGFLLNLEYNSQRTINKLSFIEDKLDILEKSVNKDVKVPSIFGEFATRGMLSTLKTLEHKVDRSNLLLHQSIANKKGREKNSNETESHYLGKGKYIVTCATPVAIEELVKDMSSKVDLVYDKIVSNDEEESSSTESSIENEYPEESFQSDEENPKKPIAYTELDKKSVKRVIKHLVCPSNKKLKSILNEIYVNQEFLKNITDILVGEDSFDVTNGALYINLKNIIDSNNNMILSKLKMQERSLNTTSNLKNHINILFKNLSVKCQNTEKNIQNDYSTTESLDQNDKYVTSTFYNLDDDKFSTTDNQFVSTTNSFYDNDEGLLYENVYFTNVLDLSNDIVKRTSSSNYTIDFCQNPGSERYCDDEGYFTIQRRVDKSENFSKSWNEYKYGFGDLDSGNFWIGNEAIHSLTLEKNDYSYSVLKIELEDFDGNQAIAQYDNFKVASEDYYYKLTIGDYFGNASDSLTYHNNTEFSTYDKTNDRAPSCCPCSNSYGGGWWFQSCFESNLNGIYYDKPTEDDFRGIIWEHWSGETSLAKTRMSVKMINDWKNRKVSVEDP